MKAQKQPTQKTQQISQDPDPKIAQSHQQHTTSTLDHDDLSHYNISINQHCVQIQQQQCLPMMMIPQCRIMRPSLLNKSSIQILCLSNCNLTQMPVIGQNIQKIDISNNYIKTFPTGCSNLKQLNIQHNVVSVLPEDMINSMQYLKILKANHNKITIIPYLKYIRYLELFYNPIILLSTRLRDSKLEYMGFDWIGYLVNNIYVANGSNNNQNVGQLCELIQVVKLHKKYNSNSAYGQHQISQFVDFITLFELRKCQPGSGLQLQSLIHKCITQKSHFFLQFLLTNYTHINFNAYLYKDRPILQQILLQNYTPAYQLFKIRRSNLNDQQVYITNLLLSCRYSNLQLFQYFVDSGLKRYVIQQNQEEIVENVMKNFRDFQTSGYILGKILQLAGFTKENKKQFHLPVDYTLAQSQCICEGIFYGMSKPQINQIIDFTKAVEYDIFEPLLHFSMRARKPQLVKIVLARYRKPFIKNYIGKLAKSVRGSAFSRKLVWKYQKICIKQLFQAEKQQQIKQKTKLDKQKWLNIVYQQKQRNAQYILPYKNKNQRKMQNSFISQRIQSAQRRIHQRKMLSKLHFDKKPGFVSHSFSYPETTQFLEQTGIVHDFALKFDKQGFSNTNKKVPFEHTESSLSMYQNYHSALLSIFKQSLKNSNSRQASPPSVSTSQKVSKSFIFSPLSICQQVYLKEDQENQQQFQSHKKIQTIDKFQLCRGPCQDVPTKDDEDQIRI